MMQENPNKGAASPLAKITQVIETTIESFGIDITNTRNESPGQWMLYKDIYELYIDLWEVGTEQNPFLFFQANNELIYQVIVPLCYMPQENVQAFLLELTDLNHFLIKASFMTRSEDDIVCLKFRDTANDLTQARFIESLDAVGYYAVLFGNHFKDKYQVKLMERED